MRWLALVTLIAVHACCAGGNRRVRGSRSEGDSVAAAVRVCKRRRLLTRGLLVRGRVMAGAG